MWSSGDMIIDRVKPWYVVKHISVLLYPPQMSHGQTWNQTRVSTVRNMVHSHPTSWNHDVCVSVTSIFLLLSWRKRTTNTAGRVHRPKNWSGCGVNFSIHAGNHTSVQPTACHFTDWTISAYNLKYPLVKGLWLKSLFIRSIKCLNAERES